jgi:hypothetical protein
MRQGTDTISVYAVQRQLLHFPKAESNLTTGNYCNYAIKNDRKEELDKIVAVMA